MRNNPTSKSPKPLLSVEEAAILLGETRSTLYRAIKAGDFPLPIFRIGRRIRIPRRSVERLLSGLPLTPPDDLQPVPPHPDAMSHTFATVRTKGKVATDVHMHSLRHFHATVLDPVISEAQKQTRLGWSTVKMARHYTDSVPEEDRRAAAHVGNMLSSGATGSGAPAGSG